MATKSTEGAKRKRMEKNVRERVVLITGFEPFGGDSVNPSLEIARHLHGTVIGGHRVVGALLPCVFGEALKELRGQLRAHKPALAICLGQASSRKEITPERVAINVDDARIPDNAERQPIDTPIVRGGPVAYWSTLPVKAIVAALREKEIPASVSQTAGTYVCNHVFYGLMHALNKTKTRGGFIHVPRMRGQAKGKGGLEIQTMIDAVRTAVAVSLAQKPDVRKSGGQTD